jgi:glycosyltransferase involved in cell wall biosynthesis
VWQRSARAARLEPEKDVASLLEAMQSVQAAHPQAVCVVAGDGSQKAALQQRIEEAGLQNAVRLLGFRSDVLGLINAADIFVLPSPAEPFGLVLLEAMALGKPVIATQAGGPLEIVVPDETGVLVPPRDANALGTALCRLLEDTTAREEMGRKGRARFEATFNARRMACETIEVYRRALDNRL